MPTKIFVGNVSMDAKSYEIREKFEKFGKVVECDIIKNYAFVHMEHEDDAKAAIAALHKCTLHGLPISVEASTGKRTSNSDNYGRYRGGGRGGGRGRDFGGGRGRDYGGRGGRDDRRGGRDNGYSPRDRDPYYRREDPYERRRLPPPPPSRDPYARDPYQRDPYYERAAMYARPAMGRPPPDYYRGARESYGAADRYGDLQSRRYSGRLTPPAY